MIERPSDHPRPRHPSEAMTPEELGIVFAQMPSDEQARFFNGIKIATEKWGKYSYGSGEMQWCWLRDEMLKPENKSGLEVAQSMSAWHLFHAWENGL